MLLMIGGVCGVCGFLKKLLNQEIIIETPLIIVRIFKLVSNTLVEIFKKD